MKKTLIIMFLAVLSGLTFGQNDPVGDLMKKYSGKEGFTTINFSGDMLRMMSKMQEEKSDTVFESKITSLHILTTEKGENKPVVNFMDEVYDKLDKSVYKEMVTIKEAGQDVVILANEKDDRIFEVLIIVGGKDDNVLIQIKGNMLLEEMAELSGDFEFNGFEHLKELEK